MRTGSQPLAHFFAHLAVHVEKAQAGLTIGGTPGNCRITFNASTAVGELEGDANHGRRWKGLGRQHIHAACAQVKQDTFNCIALVDANRNRRLHRDPVLRQRPDRRALLCGGPVTVGPHRSGRRRGSGTGSGGVPAVLGLPLVVDRARGAAELVADLTGDLVVPGGRVRRHRGVGAAEHPVSGAQDDDAEEDGAGAHDERHVDVPRLDHPPGDERRQATADEPHEAVGR